jgi:hypothetical protein
VARATAVTQQETATVRFNCRTSSAAGCGQKRARSLWNFDSAGRARQRVQPGRPPVPRSVIAHLAAGASDSHAAGSGGVAGTSPARRFRCAAICSRNRGRGRRSEGHLGEPGGCRLETCGTRHRDRRGVLSATAHAVQQRLWQLCAAASLTGGPRRPGAPALGKRHRLPARDAARQAGYVPS